MDKTEIKAIKDFMLPVVLCTLILEGVTVLVFLIIGKFDIGVICGALWGTAVMSLYYFMMATAVVRAATGDPELAKKRSAGSYMLRLAVLVGLMGLGLYLSASKGLFNWIPMLLAAIYPRISIGVYRTVTSVRQMYSGKPENKDGDEK